LTIPALNVRRAQTTVELPSGGSFAIAGLLQQTNKQVINEFPGLANMPVLGALFRSRDYQNNETELVVLVSAYLVRPTSEKRLAAPTDNFVPPTDLDTILMGRLNAEHPAPLDGLKSAANTKNGFIVQ
jgi:pilus assembly protein CpaC